MWKVSALSTVSQSQSHSVRSAISVVISAVQKRQRKEWNERPFLSPFFRFDELDADDDGLLVLAVFFFAECLLFEGTRESACSPTLISRASTSVYFLPVSYLCFYYFSIFFGKACCLAVDCWSTFIFKRLHFCILEVAFLISTFLFVPIFYGKYTMLE